MTIWKGTTGGYLLAEDLRQQVYDALSTKPGRSCVVPGEIAWDECSCGLHAVTTTGWSLSDSFPDGAVVSRYVPCAPPWVVYSMTMVLLRCAPMLSESGAAPSCAEFDAAAQQLEADAFTMLNTVTCRLVDLVDQNYIVNYEVGEHRPLGPMADCVGSGLAFQVALDRGPA